MLWVEQNVAFEEVVFSPHRSLPPPQQSHGFRFFAAFRAALRASDDGAFSL